MKLYRLGTTWEWVNDNRIVFFGIKTFILVYKYKIIIRKVLTECRANSFMTSLDFCLQDISDFVRKELSLSERAFYQACEGNWPLFPVVFCHAGHYCSHITSAFEDMGTFIVTQTALKTNWCVLHSITWHCLVTLSRSTSRFSGELNGT